LGLKGLVVVVVVVVGTFVIVLVIFSLWFVQETG
jgi:uncharacterized membrane protein YqiK